MTNPTADISARLKNLSKQFNGHPPPPRPLHLISAKQLSYLTILIHRHGKAAYRTAKNACGVDKPLPRMSKRDAQAVIRYLTEAHE